MARLRVDVRDAAAAAAPAASAFAVPTAPAALVPLGARGPVPAASAAARPIPLAAPDAPRPGAPADGSSTAGSSPQADAVRRGVGRTARFAVGVIRNAAIAVAFMTLIPLALVAVRGSAVQRLLYISTANIDLRMQEANHLREFRVATDASITPMQAGLALDALQSSHHTSPGFRVVKPAVRPLATWRTTPLASDLFPTARPDLYSGPSSKKILEAAARGLNARELAYLRTLATAPIWTDFDVVARARAVDVIGGRYVTPFPRSARYEQFPLLQYRDLRELAYAAVSRAAYHVAIGQRDSAEAVLRSVVSFGFALVDNGPTSTDALIGTVIVGIGRDALQRLYVIDRDPRAWAPALSPPRHDATASASAAGALSDEEIRRRLLGRVDDPALPLFERFSAVQRLPMLSCTNPRELFFGLRPDARAVLAGASQAVARFPSERSFIELVTRPFVLPMPSPLSTPIRSAAVSMASVAGIVFDNPQLAQCTALLVERW